MSRALAAALLASAAACASVPALAPGAEPGAVHVVPAPGPPAAALESRAADPGYDLLLCVRSEGIDLSSGIGHLRSLSKTEDGGPRKDVGHCWIELETPAGRLVVGHTGEAGKDQPGYGAGVARAMERGDPNAIAYLWTEMTDGSRWTNERGMRPTYRCRVPITAAQAAAITDFVEGFDYARFALVGRACSHFAVEAARLADVPVPNLAQVEVPQRIRYMGRTRTLWTDPAYAVIEYGSPEVFEQGLRDLVARGAAEAVDLERR